MNKSLAALAVLAVLAVALFAQNRVLPVSGHHGATITMYNSGMVTLTSAYVQLTTVTTAVTAVHCASIGAGTVDLFITDGQGTPKVYANGTDVDGSTGGIYSSNYSPHGIIFAGGIRVKTTAGSDMNCQFTGVQ